MLTRLSAACAVLLATLPTLHAAEIAPAQGVRADFTNGASMLVYYTRANDGFHVVATVQSDDTAGQAVVRFAMVLADGQKSFVSVPHSAGAKAEVMRIAHVGDRLEVGPAAAMTE